ncbi:hypothetical protein VT569_05155 [Flavobacterium psychrophilum]|uniref:hypothetical protein n=1 Tax=Flavobacterium psychrophilum TaxID=96345 RepID=UPI003B432E7A
MQQKIFIFLGFLILFISCNSKNEINNDLKKNNLFGNIKSINKNHYDATEKFGEPVKLNNTSTTSSLILFNNFGNIMEETEKYYMTLLITKCKYDDNKLLERNLYNEDGTLSNRTKFKYDEKSNLIEENIYDKQGNSKLKFVNKYNNLNQIIESHGYHENKVTFKIMSIYDSAGNKIREKAFDCKENIFYRDETFRYDENKNIISSISFNDYGTFKTNMISNMKYDDYNNIILDSFKNELDGRKGSNTYKYEYDSEKNWTKQVKFKNGKPIKIIEREIDYY